MQRKKDSHKFKFLFFAGNDNSNKNKVCKYFKVENKKFYCYDPDEGYKFKDRMESTFKSCKKCSKCITELEQNEKNNLKKIIEDKRNEFFIRKNPSFFAELIDLLLI